MDTFNPEMTEAEAIAKLEEAVAHTRQHIQRARRHFGQLLEMAQARRAHAEAQLEEARRGLAEAEADPDAPEAVARFRLLAPLANAYGAGRRMMEIEEACYAYNLHLLDFDAHDVPDPLVFRQPARDVDYLEARAYMDVHVAIALMTAYLDGADLVMRATVEEGVVQPRDEEDAGLRAHLASALKAAMAADRDLATAATHMGQELLEAYALIDWGKSVLSDAEGLPEAARRAMFEDPDWALLNAKVVFLCGLSAKAAAHPLLAPFFPPAPGAPLPFASGSEASALAGQTV